MLNEDQQCNVAYDPWRNEPPERREQDRVVEKFTDIMREKSIV